MKLGATESEQERIVNQGYQPRTWRMWTTGFGGTSSLDRDAASPDLDARTGVGVGIDALIDRTLLVGVAGGYTHSSFSVDSLTTSGTIEGGHVGLYGVKRLGPFYLAALADYGHYSNDTDRFIDFVVDDRATGSFSSDGLGGRIEAGWRQYYGLHQVTPFVALDVAHLWSDGFTEESNGLMGLTFRSGSVTSTTSSLGVQFDTRVILANGQILTPFTRVAWVHEFNPDRGVDLSLSLAPEALFSTDTPFAVGDLAKVVTGLKLYITANTGLFAYFDGEFSDRSQSYSGKGGIRILW
jgi:outer membrane autotransporter protein